MKPGLQAAFYHARQPVLILLAGSLIALAINFSLAQVHLSQSPEATSETVTLENPNMASADNTATLDGFALESDPKAKSLKITLKRGDSSAKPLQIKQSRHGNQFSLVMEKTQLSQGMVDNGLPVVIDNHNKLIARAVPGRTVTQSKIIIPNMPSGETYDVAVYEEFPGKAPRLLTPQTQIATQTAARTLPQAVRPSTAQVSTYSPDSTSPFKPSASSHTPVAISVQTTPQNNKPVPKTVRKEPETRRTQIASSPAKIKPSRRASQERPALNVAEAPLLRLSKQSERTSQAAIEASADKPQPRPAIAHLDSRFERQMLAMQSEADATLASQARTEIALTRPLANQPIAMATVETAKPKRERSRGISIIESKTVESKTVSAGQTISRPQAGNDLPQVVQSPTSSKPQTKGAITYVPHFGDASGQRSSASPFPFWNPYVVKDSAEQEADAQSSILSTNAPPPAFSAFPQTATASASSLSRLNSDPLWYLHQLPTGSQNASVSPQGLSLQAVPNLNSLEAGAPDAQGAMPGVPETLSLSDNPNSNPSTLTTGTIQVDNRLFHSLKETFSQMPIWFYIVFGLFFGGIGLFATLGSLILLYQLVIILRQSLQAITPGAKTVSQQEAILRQQASSPQPQQEQAPKVPSRREIEEVRFPDSAHVDTSAYLNHSRTLNQQQAVRQAVKKSVLLQFPSHRVGNRSGKPSADTPASKGDKKASNFVL